MDNFLFVKMTESDKRFLILFLVVIFVIIAFAILICFLVEKVSKTMGKQLDKLMHDTVVTGVIKNAKQFKEVANKKNRIKFYLSARIPILLIIISLLIATIFMGATNKWDFIALFSDFGTKVEGQEFAYAGGIGFATILYLWDFGSAPHANFFGMDIVSGFAPKLQNPHFEVGAIASYFFVPLFIVGLVWFALNVQAFASRKWRIYKLAESIYDKSLDNVKFDDLANFKSVNGVVTYNKPANPPSLAKPDQNNNNLSDTKKADDNSSNPPSVIK